MIVLSIQNAPPKLRGYLTKYMFQISSGVYVGNVNAKIRDAIWDRIIDMSESTTKAIFVHTTNTEQGFEFKTLHNSWKPIDYDGLELILIPYEKEIQIHPVSDSYVVLDLETTGLNPKVDDILEIGAILVENQEIVAEYDELVCTNVPDDITELTGITQEMSDAGVDILDALNGLNEFISKRDVIGYNIKHFDLPFLLEAYNKYNMEPPIRKVIDVFSIIRHKKPDAKSYKLKNIADDIGISIGLEPHRAIADCKLCKYLYDYCRDIYRS